MYVKFLATFITLGAVAYAAAAEPPEIEAIESSLKSVLPEEDITRIEESKIPGLFMVLVGTDVYYFTADGRYVLSGDLMDLHDKINLSEHERSRARLEVLEKIPEDQYIEFSPENPEHTIYVFTDITCGFCQKLQGDINAINRSGIAVKYLAFPREGVDSVTSRRMEHVWCADDRQAALTNAMIGLNVDPASCENPVNEHYMLGQTLRVRGTPAIFTEDGRYLPGYLPPEDLLKAVSKQ